MPHLSTVGPSSTSSSYKLYRFRCRRPAPRGSRLCGSTSDIRLKELQTHVAESLVGFISFVSSSRMVLAFKLLRTSQPAAISLTVLGLMTQSVKLATQTVTTRSTRCLGASLKSHLWSIACCFSSLFLLAVNSADTRKNTTNHHNVKYGEKLFIFYSLFSKVSD